MVFNISFSAGFPKLQIILKSKFIINQIKYVHILHVILDNQKGSGKFRGNTASNKEYSKFFHYSIGILLSTPHHSCTPTK